MSKNYTTPRSEVNSSDEITVEITDDPFTLVPNFIINDHTLLLETRMTWIYLFSKRNVKNHWTPRPWDIQKALGFGDYIWRKVSKQLRDLGYLKLVDTANGSELKFTWDWKYKPKHK